MMKKSRFSLMIAALAAFFVMGTAEAATLALTFKDKATDTPLQYGYIYLRSAASKEKFFTQPEVRTAGNPDHIYGVTNASGVISAAVPNGTYYIRVTRRKNTTDHAKYKFGPPEPGDYSWTPYLPITISADTNLGTVYADRFGGAVVTGVITDKQGGQALVGRYVRAQTEACMTLMVHGQVNQCGPVKLLAEQKTDAQGRYRLVIRDPGVYYIVTSQALGEVSYYGNIPATGWSAGPITVDGGAQVTQNIQVPSGY